MRTPSLFATLLLAAASANAQQLLPTASPERCTTAAANIGSATAWLDHAAATILPPADSRVLRYAASQDVPLWEQSDRMYEPFIPNGRTAPHYYDPQAASDIGAGGAPVRPSLLNPWFVLSDWRAHASDARVTARCWYRDAWRVVLTRDKDKLYLSESDATPIKLERIESHYLWGQVKAEYLWSTYWGTQGGGYFPNAAFRIFDGAVYERMNVVNFHTALIPRDSVPVTPARPQPTAAQAAAQSAAAAALNAGPDTVRIAEHTFLLTTPIYTQVATLQRDTVFLFDATTSEARARQDSTWVAKLFPGKHPVVLVVTDLAWPHISGVRFWVARGATVVSHRESEEFLRRVVNRRWTLNPDALEKTRATAHFKFRAVTDSLRLAGGAIVLYALQNTSTETAIGAWVPGDKFFWAGDYIQADPQSPYVRDAVATIRALGLHPEKVGAQHIKLSDWSKYDQMFPVPAAKGGSAK